MFTKKELECIEQVSRLAKSLAKNEKRLQALMLSKSKQEESLKRAVKKYEMEKEEEKSILNLMNNLRTSLAISLQDPRNEPIDPKQIVKAPTTSHYELGREV